jgi:hypothetical protein
MEAAQLGSARSMLGLPHRSISVSVDLDGGPDGPFAKRGVDELLEQR